MEKHPVVSIIGGTIWGNRGAESMLVTVIGKLREMSPLWDMYKEGIDLNTVQWAAH